PITWWRLATRKTRGQSIGPAAAVRTASVRRSDGGHIAQAATSRNSGENERAIRDCPAARRSRQNGWSAMRSYVHATSYVWTWLRGCFGCEHYPEKRPLYREVGGQKSRFHLTAPGLVRFGEATSYGRKLVTA